MSALTDQSIEYTIKVNWFKVAIVAWYIVCAIAGAALQIWLFGLWGFVAIQTVMTVLGIIWARRRIL